jgi:hypothetical protein
MNRIQVENISRSIAGFAERRHPRRAVTAGLAQRRHPRRGRTAASLGVA